MPDGAAQAGDQERMTQSGSRLAVQAVLGLLAVLLLLWLANIVTQYEDPVLAGLAGSVSQDGWIGITVFLLIVILAVEILLLVPGMARRAGGAPVAYAEPVEEERVYMIGCSGCGTVFDRREHEIDEAHERRFECPNCGRTGEIRDYDEHLHDIAMDTCNACGTRYQRFKDVAECPNCHAAQD